MAAKPAAPAVASFLTGRKMAAATHAPRPKMEIVMIQTSADPTSPDASGGGTIAGPPSQRGRTQPDRKGTINRANRFIEAPR